MKPPTILVVEDNPISRKMMRFALESEGYAVLEAGDGQGALAVAEGRPPDLVVLDYVLPDMDGLSTEEGLRALPGGSDVPVLMVTGMVSRLEELRARASPATFFLAKPIEPSVLIEVVRTHLAKGGDTVGKGRKVLVVDDEPLNCKLASLRLRDAGFETDTAASGTEAIQKAHRSPPDAILSDVLMPGLDGFGLCAAVRRNPRLSHLPVVLLSSAYVEEADRRLAREMRANALLVRKPDLAEAIQALVDGLEEGAPPPGTADEEALVARHKERLQIQIEKQLARNEALLRQGAIQAAALSVIRGLAEMLATPGELASVLSDVLVHCLDASGLSTGLLYLVGSEGRLRLQVQTGLSPETRKKAEDYFGGLETLRRVLESGEPVAYTAGRSEPPEPGLSEIASALASRSILLFSFHAGREPLGVLLLASDSQDLSEKAWRGFARALSAQFGQTIALGRALSRGAATEARYQSLMEHASDAILVLNMERRIVEANRQTEELLGRTRAAMIGLLYDELVVPEERQDALAGWARLRAEGANRTEGRHLQRADGSRVSVDVSSAIVEIGEERAAMSILRDITERQRAEAEKEHLEAQLRQAQKMEAIGQLAGGVAHDFNNLLGVITGYGELLLKRLAPEHPGRKLLEQIRTAADRAAALTRQLLAFSRKQVLEPKVLDLNDTVETVEKMLRRVIPENVQIQTVLGANLGPVKADPGQIEQVILNLAVNARDAMPSGGQLILETANARLDQAYVRAHAEAHPGSYVMLAVTDTGIGMDAETQAHLFEPFFTTKDPGKGTGLGLATVFGTVKQSGGHINVYSEPGRGSTFKIYLPRIEEEPTARGTEVQAPPSPLPTGTETILLVEDAEALRVMIREVLEGSGYTVLEAALPEEALALAQDHPGSIHLILTDVVLPRMSGPDLAADVRRLRSGVQVLYMSGYAADAIGKHGGLEPGAGFLQKPFTAESLLRKLRAVLGAVSP